MIVFVILFAFTAISISLTLWQWWEARHFPLRVGPGEGRESTSVVRDDSPPTVANAVTVLKPLKGCDGKTAECLASWFQQSYRGEFEILFGVAQGDDPAVGLVRKLIAAHPEIPARLIICDPLLGANAKVSSLIHLVRCANYDVLVISDADVHVPGDFLERTVPALEENTGLVNCFYALADAPCFAMRWEAVAINADFWPQVLQARRLQPMDFALGAVMITRRQDLLKIGGFEGLVNYLADDYELGHRLAAAGKTIHLSDVVVECRSDALRWAEVWPHQLRWARTVRVCRPGPYFLSILNNATFWPLLLIVVVGGAWFARFIGLDLVLWAAGTAVVCGLVRAISAWDCQRHILRARIPPAPWWMPFIKDVLQVMIWVFAFLGDEVVWRGQKFRVFKGGKLMPK